MSPEDLSKFQPNLIEGTLSEINFSTDVQSCGLSEKPAISLALGQKKYLCYLLLDRPQKNFQICRPQIFILYIIVYKTTLQENSSEISKHS